MEKGVLRRMDTGAAARCFLGPLIAFVLTREVFPQPDSETLSSETMVKTIVEVFLRGMEI
jgi:TetR/AcrR family transcriptional regulator, mexJK operon transcriptional repressor